MSFTSYMPAALAEARAAAERGEVPVGAVITDAKGQIIAADGNRTKELNDPTAHAEVLTLRAACTHFGTDRLPEGCTLWVTLEPCAMCATAASYARIGRICYGADDPKSGGLAHGAKVFTRPQCHHAPEVIEGISADEAAQLLKDFFAKRR